MTDEREPSGPADQPPTGETPADDPARLAPPPDKRDLNLVIGCIAVFVILGLLIAIFAGMSSTSPLW